VGFQQQPFDAFVVAQELLTNDHAITSPSVERIRIPTNYGISGLFSRGVYVAGVPYLFESQDLDVHLPAGLFEMPPIRRILTFTILILLLIASRDVLRSLYAFQYSGFSCTGIAQSPLDQSVYNTSTQVETSIPGSELITGFTLLDRLYLSNGTFFIVTANLSAFPSRWNMIAPGKDLSSGNMEPTDKELRFLDTSEVDEVLGHNAIQVDGFSIIVYDTKQFMPHYYHWWGEIILGSWRVYSAIFATISPPPPPPARFILPFVHDNEWRDPAGVSAVLMRASFPSTAIEVMDYWKDLTALNRTIVFDRAMIVSRETTGRHPLSGKWYKMISPTLIISPPPDFFEPVRRVAITSLLGYLPIVHVQGANVSLATSRGNATNHDVQSNLPVVTYISRQGGGRQLGDADHEGLVHALRELEEEGVCKVNVVKMQTLTVREQMSIVARSTVLVGVHGNGMTHEIWMPRSSRSTVIEIFTPNGYLFDYEILARNVGHKHYAVWNDTLMTFPKGTYHEGVNYPNGFDFIPISVHGPSVAQVIRERLTGDLPGGG